MQYDTATRYTCTPPPSPVEQHYVNTIIQCALWCIQDRSSAHRMVRLVTEHKAYLIVSITGISRFNFIFSIECRILVSNGTRIHLMHISFQLCGCDRALNASGNTYTGDLPYSPRFAGFFQPASRLIPAGTNMWRSLVNTGNCTRGLDVNDHFIDSRSLCKSTQFTLFYRYNSANIKYY